MPSYVLFRSTVQMQDATLDPASLDWVFSCSTLSAATPLLVADVSVAIQHFYLTTAGGSGGSYASYMAQAVDATKGIAWTAYDITGHLNGTPHGSPINAGNYPLTPFVPSTQIIPEGVAASLSFRGNYGTDVEFVRDPVTHKVTQRPRSRHRGRMFLGPLGGTAFAADPTTKRTRLTNTFCNSMIAQLNGSLTITDSGSNKWHLGHWSRKNASVEDLVLISMDDRPDYQRRRADQSMVKYSATAVYT